MATRKMVAKASARKNMHLSELAQSCAAKNCEEGRSGKIFPRTAVIFVTTGALIPGYDDQP